MEKLFSKISETLASGGELVLLSIIASSGSTPRGSGAKMALFKDGSTLGTIGGGAVEFESIKRAREALKEKRAFTEGFCLAPNQTADIGMICGGSVTVYFQYLSGGDKNAVELFSYAAHLFERSVDSWLITQIQNGGVSRMSIYEHGKGLMFSALDENEIMPLLTSRGELKKGEPSLYCEPLTQAGYAYIFGGGHVSKELVPVIAHVGFKPVVYEDRHEFSDIKLFPGAVRTIEASFANINDNICITKSDYVIIMTRGHQNDYELLRQTLMSPAAYVGVIGSKHKIAATNAKLLEAGVPAERIAQIHTPIGMPIKGETPAEIAISIAAELILTRAELKE